MTSVLVSVVCGCFCVFSLLNDKHNDILLHHKGFGCVLLAFYVLEFGLGRQVECPRTFCLGFKVDGHSDGGDVPEGEGRFFGYHALFCFCQSKKTTSKKKHVCTEVIYGINIGCFSELSL